MSDAQALDAVVAALTSRRPLPALFPTPPWTPWDADLRRRLVDGDLAALPPSVRAGLHLWNDALGEAHTLVQGMADADGAYWHGIMHRREGDLENADYWFRRVGTHPIFPAVRTAALNIAREAAAGGNAWAGGLAETLAAGPWDPHRFIALCGQARSGGPHPVLEGIQAAECACLLRHCRAALP